METAVRARRPGATALWASTSTKNPHYSDILYIDDLIGPDRVNTLAESTMEAFEDHGTLARTIDTGLGDAEQTLHELATVGIDMEDVDHTLEHQGIAAFQASYLHVLGTLEALASTRSDG